MPITTYVNFNGTCKDALLFYEDVFQTNKPNIMTYREMPGGEVPDHLKDMVLHADINILGTTLYASDTPNDEKHPFVYGNQIILAIEAKDVEQATHLFHRLKEKGEVIMDLAPSFFSQAYGEVKDQFGVHWMVLTES